MPLINTAVPNLIQGVSQQPDATRFAGQCEEQENALSSVADGLKKRPNTRHIARLMTTAISENSFVHFINRSDSEKYVVIHDGYCLKAYNTISGVEATINGSTGGLNISAGDYLDSSNPRAELKGLTIADSTLLLNSSKAVAPKLAKTSALPKEALVYIAQGDYSKRYQVDVEVVTAGNAPTPTSTTLPEITLNMSRYLYNTTISGGWNRRTSYYYRWRVSGVTITDAGANISSSLQVNISSNKNIYTQASINLIVSNNIVVGATVTTAGDFEGVTSANAYLEYGGDAPTLTDTISGGAVNSAGTRFAKTTTTSTNASTTSIANLLNAEMGTAADATNGGGFADFFTRSRPNNGNNIYLAISLPAQHDFTISTTDSLADTGMKSIYKEVDALSSLPIDNKNGFKVKIKGDPELAEDDYYVEFQTNQGQAYGGGSYVETVGDEIVTGCDASTLPHQLVNNAFNSFTFSQVNYADRIAGDDDSNPLPSFTGSEISAMFFFKNRLGFLSKDNIIMSESGFGAVNDQGQIVFNFGRTSVTTLLDSDPIDISVASSRVTNLKSAKGFQENLVMFSENGQFVMKGGDVLTPRTVSVTPITNFSFEDQVDPLLLGSYLYFPFTRGAFTGMREFTVNASNDTYDAAEVTEHVPAYIPKNIIDMAGTTSEDMIALLSGEDYSDGTNARNELYIYNYFWNNNQKVLSAWSKFTFTGEIRGIEFVESTLYAVIVNNGETNLVEMPLESGLKDDAGYVTHLDMRVASTVANGASTITLPHTPADNTVEVYTTDGLKLSATNSGATVTLTQAVKSDTPVFTGIPYNMKYTFSEQLFKAKAGNSTSPSNAAKLLIRNGSIYFNNTAFFKVKVTPKFRDTYENIFTPDVVGSTTIGTLNLDSGFYRFPVLTKAQDTKISIENDSALPSNFQSAEFESFLHSRSSRYA